MWGWGWSRGFLLWFHPVAMEAISTVSPFNKHVKAVCRASLDIIYQLHTITKLSKIPCRDHTLPHYQIYFYFDYDTFLKPCFNPNEH